MHFSEVANSIICIVDLDSKQFVRKFTKIVFRVHVIDVLLETKFRKKYYHDLKLYNLNN